MFSRRSFVMGGGAAWVAQAASKPVLDGIGAQLMAALPEDAEATILRHLRGGEDSPGEAPPPDGTDLPPAEEGAVPGDSSYGTGTRDGLDSLIQNTAAVPQ